MRIIQEVNKLNEYVLQKMEHSFLKEYVNVPQLNQDKCLITYLLLAESGYEGEELQELYAAVMLVQCALDTHETILKIRDSHIKERQLTVLAGDYYSSLYYFMLSVCEDVSLIRALSLGIQDVNENKMRLFYSKHIKPEEVTNSIKGMEAGILNRVARHLKKEQYIPFITEFLFVSATSHCPDSLFSDYHLQIKNDVLLARHKLKTQKQPLSLKPVMEKRMRGLLEGPHYLLPEEG
ncbi:Heptaprenyl diphosphate synthase (HEPPP synthase) subunit 1 [Fictibacillus solisalsi]|uniref:Heptaprenyl diphosphate synthase (HEPPP synthase) subunit 1 n=1 Tax=Fictibacillus solisalsi TaxID=459525 RepID=A0A1G9VZS5_9BACL|nr:heptaprenyl diphosphate synthase component 1 [Fictibacillus solisalsi]SDM77477.1 Heptaprenyl diphosphate synthase (HEPPP synthase) subunit 1 [Fictibacillus solisalsi]